MGKNPIHYSQTKHIELRYVLDYFDSVFGTRCFFFILALDSTTSFSSSSHPSTLTDYMKLVDDNEI